ncbi:MerR family transcriptional regulator [Dactylosporangium matsuzakiense]|uniref:MerR family transcriptional regulator n=1 Tax=Dactylosporangium matsuzakiense TaxID=53360 RepID=A0A9W6KNC7_9ACTN|nr:MerR family transcriptional regulator [Dactylosporangium matsuzakiense]UWZ47466.1 MerR family transcriptional regulator [Dactylosporangium matsuzakiense]GLL05221.1 MerR family transcriptional regulator [Dactylosporangium matsuzakiense]
MRIGDVARATGVSVRALRYYEEQQLLAPVRSVSGQRLFAPSAVERVQLIQTLFAAGLSSRSIHGLLPCVDAKANTPESRAILRDERQRIDEQIARLEAARDRLDAVIAESESPTNGCVVFAGPAAG